MANPVERIKEQLPQHFAEYHPKFITFFEKYYEWLHRQGGFTKEEVDVLKNDPSWIVTDIDKFIFTKQKRYIYSQDERNVINAIVERNAIPAPGTESDNLHSDYLLERRFDTFETADQEIFETADSYAIDAPRKNKEFIREWNRRFGFAEMFVKPATDALDTILLVKLLKHINNIKGTRKSMELFFSMFFNEENIEVYLPKQDILTLDENFIPDSTKSLRDDSYYNEFTYVIRLEKEPSFYQDSFEKVFLQYIHPSGFKVVLEQKSS